MDYSKFPSQTPTRKAWQGMMNRCYTTTNKDYPGVGGVGITVASEWHRYENFLRDMGEKPAGTLLSRYVTAHGFTPENTYWQPKVNSRTNHLYAVWKGMRRRCGVVGTRSDYTLRGVTIYPEWAESFAEFAAAVGQPPSSAHQLDRIDNDAGYVPGNVHWVLPKENANNRSDNVVIEMYGKRQTLQQWCDEFGVPRSVVTGRWRKLFEASPGKNRRCQQMNAETAEVLNEFNSVQEASEVTDLPRATIYKCLSGGNATAGGFAWRYVD